MTNFTAFPLLVLNTQTLIITVDIMLMKLLVMYTLAEYIPKFNIL